MHPWRTGSRLPVAMNRDFTLTSGQNEQKPVLNSYGNALIMHMQRCAG
jgi:hypothetical protein